MLQEIMRRGTSSLGADVPSEREINRLAARSQEEFRIFEEMDKNRRKEENYRSRLMQEQEVPEWAYSKPDKPDKSKSFENTGVLGKRRRKEVVYADSLSESQWIKAVENGQDVSQTPPSKFKRRDNPVSELHESASNSSVVKEKKVMELRSEPVVTVSEATSEDTSEAGVVTVRQEDQSAEQKTDLPGLRVSGLNGHVLTWNTYKKKRSSYVLPTSSDSKGQNSNGRGNGRP